MESTILLSGTTVIAGQPKCGLNKVFMVTAFLGSGGGTATANVYGRAHSAAPWKTLGTFALSGVNDQDHFTVVNEVWPEIFADISAISGGATVTVVMGS